MRLAGIDIPDNKRGEISLTYIFGLGKSSANKILNEAGIALSYTHLTLPTILLV